MDTKIINSPHKNFEQIKKIDENGFEYWEARELMPLLGYTKWSNFEGIVIKKAKIACSTSGQTIKNHFADIGKMVGLGSGSKRKINNYHLSRYACYLIAQNGDSSKKAIAHAQTYFAIQTRKQEIFQQLEDDGKRIYVREQVKDHNKELFSTAKEIGVSNFGRFNNAGYEGLYGMNAKQLKNKKGIGKDDVLDRAGTTELAANLFRITQTDEKLKRDNIKGQFRADQTHKNVGKEVRKTIVEIGGTMPENLNVEPHIKEIKKSQKKLSQNSTTAKNLEKGHSN
ncbi:MAG: DNA damage-inducible protein D [bacterium]|nr:DNA damage-inducible protein D [bacterium]